MVDVPVPRGEAVQDQVRGRQAGQGVRDRLLTADPPPEALGIEDAALPIIASTAAAAAVAAKTAIRWRSWNLRNSAGRGT